MIRNVLICNLRGLLCKNRLENAQVERLSGLKKEVIEKISESILWWCGNNKEFGSVPTEVLH